MKFIKYVPLYVQLSSKVMFARFPDASGRYPRRVLHAFQTNFARFPHASRVYVAKQGVAVN